MTFEVIRFRMEKKKKKVKYPVLLLSEVQWALAGSDETSLTASAQNKFSIIMY